MIAQRLVALLFLFIVIDASPIDQNIRQYEYRQRRNVGIMNWQFADALYKRLYDDQNYLLEQDARNKRSETPLELRPVAGPINIEQLPAMLAARYVKRYPYSQRDDPAVIGRR